MVASNPWHSLACSCITPISGCRHTALSLCISVSTWRFPLLVQSFWTRAQPRCNLNWITLARVLFPNKVTGTNELGLQHIYFLVTIQPVTADIQVWCAGGGRSLGKGSQAVGEGQSWLRSVVSPGSLQRGKFEARREGLWAQWSGNSGGLRS